MKNIAFISTLEGCPWGACEELWAQTAVKMQKQGFNVFANIAYTASALCLEELKKAGGRITFRQPRQSLLSRILNKISKDLLSDYWLDKHDFDLVVISQGYNFCGIDWMEKCRKRKLPYVSIAHGGSEVFWPVDKIIEQARNSYLNAQKCFFVSQRVYDLTCKELGVKLENAQLVHNPIKMPSVIFPWPEMKKIKLACVARLEPDVKGQDLLFEVLSFPKWRKRPLEITLFGGGDKENSLRRLKELWELENVTFGGVVNQVESIWKDHHALILSSRHESGPLVVPEAMLSERFCITTDVGNCSTFIQDNITGFIAQAPTVGSLDEAMERAWKRREEWKNLGKVAADEIYKMIPKDPIGVFINELIASHAPKQS